MHNPEKNRALCVVAKGSYWGLIIGGWALLVGTIGLAISTLVLKISRDWSWKEFGTVVLLMTVMAVAVGFMFLICWGCISLYDWAKAYREDC